MELELVKFINSNLTWNAVKKGHRSMMRRPRRAWASSSDFGLGVGNKKQDSAVFDYEKSGVAILGQHFTEEVLDVPIKKRILLLQSPTLSGERDRSPQPQSPSPHQEESKLLVGSKHASGEQCHSNSLLKSKNGSSNSEHLKLTEKEAPHLNDFSGIELLAAAACCSSVYDSSVHMESSAVQEHTTSRVDSYADGIKENIASMDSYDSSVQDSMFPATQNLCDNGNNGGDERLVPSKGVRLHWDLNTVMDEWEEPCDILVDPHSEKSYSKDVFSDGLQTAKVNLEGYETRNSQVIGGEQGSMLDSVCADQSEHDAAVSAVPPSKPEIFGIQGNNDGNSFGKTYDVVEDIASSKELVGPVTCKTSDTESCLSKSDVVDSIVHPPKCENISTSTASVSPGQTTRRAESDALNDVSMYLEPLNRPDDRQTAFEVVQGAPKGDGDDKLTSEDRLSDCCGSNVSEDERGHMAEGNTINKVKAGYDSPVEDGELRDSTRYSWQKNEDEEMDCVDYESDNIYEDNFDDVESVKNEITLDHRQPIGDGRFLLENRALGAVPGNDIEQGDKADASKRRSHLLGSEASECRLQERSRCASLEEKDGRLGKSHPERKNVHDEFAGGNLLWTDRSTSFGVRRNGACIRRSRSDNAGDSYSRAQRDFGPDKFIGRDEPSYQGRCRNNASGQWDGSSMGAWDSRNSHWYPRPKNVSGGSAARSGGLSSHDNNQAIPRGTYRTFNGRPSPSDRNESYGIHRGNPPARGINRETSRGGSGFHLQSLRRPPQEEHDDHEPCYSERKVPCFSPNFNRGAHLSRSRRRSRSRSRSGSPIAWHFQKRRNVDAKRQSPDYRSDPRFQGERFPSRKPSSTGEIEVGIVSPTRVRVSPQCISRCFEDRKVINCQSRDRRSSLVRTFQRNQRFEAGGYLGRLKSNDHFRSAQRLERFPQATGPYREKFEAYSNDSTIHDDKYGMMNGGRRFRYPVDESFKTRNPRNKDDGFRYTRDENRSFKDPVGRNVPENTSEEKSCRYTINKMFTTAPLSAGEGDFHKNDSQRE